MRVLVTGGVRSGKSRHAEGLLAGRSDVVYVAAGRTTSQEPDPDWVARVEAHQRRRPATWRTVETRDLARVFRGASGPVLVDCLGTWLTGQLDELELWEAPEPHVRKTIEAELDEITGALGDTADAIVVTNEVGLGVVPAYRSGRLFRDLLGEANRRFAAACDEVHLVVAGRVLKL